MKNYQKVIAVLMCCVLAVGLIPVMAAPATQATSGKLVAITFDDGPGAYTEQLLDGLAARGAKATFFLVGNRISSRLSTVQRMVREGHQIGNHSYSHPDLTTLSSASVSTELTRTRQLLVQAGGSQTYALRPPYGSHNATVRSNAGGPVILWSVDTLDWQSRNANAVYNKIINETRDGSIVLLHDIYSTSVQGALRGIDTLKQQGYEFVTVNELLRRRGITPQNGQVYTCAYNKGINLPAADAAKAPTYTTKNVFGGKQITLSCATQGATIYYTTDGSAPDESSTRYRGAFVLGQTARLRAVAYTAAGRGAELDVTLTLSKSPAPTASYANGMITLTAAKGTVLYYTTDTTVPTDKSACYKSPVKVNKRLNVLVTASGMADRIVNYTVTKYGDLLTDVPAGAWYYEAVGEAMHRGIMKGTGKQLFDPEGQVTRAMFVTALYRMSPDADNTFAAPTFTDVPKNTWYTDAVAWAQAKGIVKGMTKTQYQPDGDITREQMCAILHRYMKVYGHTLPRTKRPAFKDAADIAGWAKKDVSAMYEMGLINGMGGGVFAPAAGATRAQCAKLLVDLTLKIETV